MPSDASKAVLATLSGPRQRFLSAVASTAEELRGFLDSHGSSGDGRSLRVAAELGPFAHGRVDAARFASFLDQGEVLDPAAREVLEMARSVLDEASAWDDRAFLVELQPGADLHSAVGLGLAWLGRVFGAAAAVARAKAGHAGVEESFLVDAFPFRRWSRGQRKLAPPLVVDVEGSDLATAGLAAYLDGSQKLILLVRGPTPPAPLVRHISPDVFVLQTDDPEELAGVGTFEGPAVAALMPRSEGARFVHDPGRGATLSDRLTVSALPDGSAVQPLGTQTVWQQLQDLRQLAELKALTERAAGAPAADRPSGGGGDGANAGAVSAAAEPADALAGWLLRQASLSDA